MDFSLRGSRETGRFPVKLDGVVCGELLCQLHVPVCVGVGNLGDSRAVMGEYRCGELRTVLLSRDLSAADRTRTSPTELPVRTRAPSACPR